MQVEKAGLTVGIRPLPDKVYDMDELEVNDDTLPVLTA